jgi:hypothetical protein
MKEFLRLYREAGGGNIEYFVPSGAFGPVTATALAPGVLNDGLSVTAGIGKLGGPLGAAGAAVLLDNREIPFGGFGLTFSGLGNTGIGSIVNFRADAAKGPNIPYLLFQTPLGAEAGRINFQNNDTFIGLNVGSAVSNATTRNTGLGANALQLLQTAILNTAIGCGAMQSLVGPNTVGASVAVGDGALNQYTSGIGNSALGYQALFNIATGGNNTGLGIQAGDSVYLASADNTFVGALCGHNTLRAAVTVSQNVFVGSQSATNQGTVGSTNTSVGFGFNNGLAIALGSNNCFFGANQTTTVGTPSNSGMFGQGMDMQVSNTVMIGRSDQNVGIGQTVTAALLTSKLKVFGTLATGGAAPLTLGAGICDFGNVVTAASVLNATKYWEVVIGGVLLKVCIN